MRLINARLQHFPRALTARRELLKAITCSMNDLLRGEDAALDRLAAFYAA